MRSIPIRTIVSSVLVVTFLSVAAPAIVRAQAPVGGPAVDAPFGRPEGPARLLGPLFRILRRLQLTPDQRQQVRQVLLGHREEFRILIQRGMKARRALFSAVYLEPFDKDLIRHRSLAVAEVQAHEAVFRATIRTEIFAPGVLTQEQTDRAIELLKQFVQRRGDGSDGADTSDGSSPQ